LNIKNTKHIKTKINKENNVLLKKKYVEKTKKVCYDRTEQKIKEVHTDEKSICCR
jgi:hypothetical protein